MWGGWWAVMEVEGVEGVMGMIVGGWWWFEGKDRHSQLSCQQESAWKTSLSRSKPALSAYEPSGAESRFVSSAQLWQQLTQLTFGLELS